MKTISGPEAIARMRDLRHKSNTYFELQHITFNQNRSETDGIRLVQRCRLRPALPDEKFYPNADLYLPYIDLDINEPRMCFKKLIRFVAFPPNYKLLKVKWFNP